MNLPADTSPDGYGIQHQWDASRGLAAPLAATSWRLGGVSDKPYATLNMGYHVGDKPEAVTENRRRFLDAYGIAQASLIVPRQTHSTRILPIISSHIEPIGTSRFLAEADALITDVPGVALGVTVADCVPVFLYDAEHRAIGMAHAGWRGALGGIIQATFKAMNKAFGTSARACSAILGPSIGVCCYEVSPQLGEQFRVRFGEAVTQGRHLDLGKVVRVELMTAGVLLERIHETGLCTACRTDLFYSHRREGVPTGRLLAILSLTSPRT